jgi:hypothetical protein
VADIISGFKDNFRLRTNANQQVEIGRLALPAGSYSIWAKLFVQVPLPAGLAATIRFRLQAGGDFDITSVTHDGTIAFLGVALNVVHNFGQPGSAVLTGEHFITAGETDLGFIKITALSGTTLSNNPIP